MGAFDSLFMKLPSWMGGPSDQEREAYLNRQAQEQIDREMAAGASAQGAPVAPGQERMTLREGTLTPGGTRDATMGELIQQMQQQNNRNRTVVPNPPPRPQVPSQLPGVAPQGVIQDPQLGTIRGAGPAPRPVINGDLPKGSTGELRRPQPSITSVRG